MEDSTTADGEKLLILWQDEIPVPLWDVTESGSVCHSCGDRLSLGHRHHCRLCGKNYCSACTGLYHVQRKFQNIHKGDDIGPTRVCWDCRDLCLLKREEASKNILIFPGCFGIAVLRKKRLKFRKEDGTEQFVLHCPSSLDLVKKNAKCFTCGLNIDDESSLISRAFTCRICGELVCNTCSTKSITLPTAFK
jgi:hypothetical protein